MEEDNIYEKIKDLLGKSGGSFSILEEQIDVKLQVDFYKSVNRLLKKKRDFNSLVGESERLYNPETPDKDKMKILAELSCLEEVEAFRLIERFVNFGEKKLQAWAKLALQHSRIGLESHLLDEKQVFISTGLGGKGNRLRYFVAGKFKVSENFTDTQKELLKSELEFSFNQNKSILEAVNIYDNYFTAIGLTPLDISINEVVKVAILEANNYGDFLHKDFLVTNVRILTNDEIEQYFNKKGLD